MAVVILDRAYEDKIRKSRADEGLDKYDEVWDGVLMVMPLPNVEHQELVSRICHVLNLIDGWPPTWRVFPGLNVSDRPTGWMENYREPDVGVYLPGNAARDRQTYMEGGPDFLVEVVSDDDRSRDKLEFYAGVNSREALYIDRDPWQIELYALAAPDVATLVGTSSLANNATLASAVLPVTFLLVPGPTRPLIEIAHSASGRSWQC